MHWCHLVYYWHNDGFSLDSFIQYIYIYIYAVLTIYINVCIYHEEIRSQLVFSLQPVHGYIYVYMYICIYIYIYNGRVVSMLDIAVGDETYL